MCLCTHLSIYSGSFSMSRESVSRWVRNTIYILQCTGVGSRKVHRAEAHLSVWGCGCEAAQSLRLSVRARASVGMQTSVRWKPWKGVEGPRVAAAALCPASPLLLRAQSSARSRLVPAASASVSAAHSP